VIEWFFINRHLIPSFIILLAGGILSVVASILYHVRKKKIIVISPIEVIGGYTRFEKKIFFAGIILAIVGLISLIAISQLYGYYYFVNGVPTLSRR
jgi:uncharacterized membrane protein